MSFEASLKEKEKVKKVVSWLAPSIATKTCTYVVPILKKDRHLVDYQSFRV
jgi:hypothetical protein